jgi:hypothetical protein
MALMAEELGEQKSDLSTKKLEDALASTSATGCFPKAKSNEKGLLPSLVLVEIPRLRRKSSHSRGLAAFKRFRMDSSAGVARKGVKFPHRMETSR